MSFATLDENAHPEAEFPAKEPEYSSSPRQDNSGAADISSVAQRAELEPVRWVDRHADALFRYTVLRVRDRSLAEDVVQETFLADVVS